jgi:hypothetical protein
MRSLLRTFRKSHNYLNNRLIYGPKCYQKIHDFQQKVKIHHAQQNFKNSLYSPMQNRLQSYRIGENLSLRKKYNSRYYQHNSNSDKKNYPDFLGPFLYTVIGTVCGITYILYKKYRKQHSFYADSSYPYFEGAIVGALWPISVCITLGIFIAILTLYLLFKLLHIIILD